MVKIDLISKKRNIVIPPPEIRIGHGLYFDGSKEYIDLLKKFKCIIEINATSNLKLSNVESLEKMPYNFYLSHGIPVVICTDGHGIYLTTIPISFSSSNHGKTLLACSVLVIKTSSPFFK